MNRNEKNNKKFVRPWGYFVNIAKGDGFLVKIIHVNPSGRLSVQSHNHRSEHWFIVKGTAEVLIDQDEQLLKQGDSINIPINVIHSVYNHTDSELELIEIQTGELLSEDDITRYEDIYGRI